MHSKLAAAALLMGLGALLGSGLSRNDVPQAQAQEKAVIPAPLTEAELGTMLTNLGYEVTEKKLTSGGSYFEVKMPAAGWNFEPTVSLSGDKRWMWVSTGLANLPQDKLTKERLEAALEINNSIGPCHLSLNKNDKEKWFGMSFARNNVGVGPAQLKSHLDHFSSQIARTQNIWDPNKWASTPTAVPADPKAAEVGIAAPLDRRPPTPKK